MQAPFPRHRDADPTPLHLEMRGATDLSRTPPRSISGIYLLSGQPKAWWPRLSLLSSWTRQVNHRALSVLMPGQGCTGLTRLPLQIKDAGLRGSQVLGP